VGVVLMDFDGTLAYRPGMWSQCMVEVLDELSPGHGVEADDLRPHLRDGFPWHRPDQPHLHLGDPEAWWRHVGSLLAEAFLSTGADPLDVPRAVAAARSHYCDPSRFQLFPDTLPALRLLKAAAWRTVVLSNHVPELPEIVRGVGISALIDQVFTSASTGYEKPHPDMFRIGLGGTPPSDAWMVGDSLEADVRGAEAIGVRAILVRRTDDSARRQSATLTEAAETILAG